MSEDQFIPRIPYEACPLCGAKDFQPFLKADCSNHALYKPAIPPGMTWCRCVVCGHMFTEGYFSEEALQIIYGDTHDNQKVGFEIEKQRYVSARMVEKVIPYVTLGDWLDVGFGNGSLLFTAQEFGFTPVGVDVRRENVEVMQRLGIEAHCEDFAKLNHHGRYEVISMADVLEHMSFPIEGLKIAHRLLGANGVIFVSMPNADSMVWNALNSNNANFYWYELEHYHNFGRKRLYQLLQDNGFEPLRFGISERYRACMEVIARKAA